MKQPGPRHPRRGTQWGWTALYNAVLLLGLPAALGWLAGVRLLRGKFRGSIMARLAGVASARPDSGDRSPVLWIHAVSVGEVIASIPLVRRLRDAYPKAWILVSTVTETGQATARSKLPEADRIVYFPFDLPWAVWRSLAAVRPRLFIVMETEIWPNFLFGLSRLRIPAILVNGRISERSFRGYRLARPFFSSVMNQFTVFSVQTALDRERLLGLGIDPGRIVQTGSLKFDQVAAAPGVDPSAVRAALRVPSDARLILAGSTHEGEERILLEIYHRLIQRRRDVRLLLAPRHLERLESVERLVRSVGLEPVRKTKIESINQEGLPLRAVVLLDTLGELQALYGAADVVFVGGSLVPVGGHNVLEPAIQGKPVVFGPHMHNFHEITLLLLESGGAEQVRTPAALEARLGALLDDASLRRERGERARAVVLANRGAVERNLALIRSILERE